MPSLHGNTAFGYEFAFLFVGIPAFSAAPLPCGMVPLATNPLGIAHWLALLRQPGLYSLFINSIHLLLSL
jgi:hypothetical protein